jgi:hypothetical protein
MRFSTSNVSGSLLAAGLLIGASGLAHWTLVHPVKLQYIQLEQQCGDAESRRNTLRRMVQENFAYLSCFSRQTNFRHHVLREKLGYAEADEVIYIFEDEHGQQSRKK